MNLSNKFDSKIILLSGSKGGCGISFIAYSISAYFAKNTNKNMLLLDLNIGKEDSRIIFDISGDNYRDLGDIEELAGELDLAILKKLIINFDSSLNLILPSLKIEKNKFYNGKNLGALLDFLRKSFDIILIDFPYQLFVQSNLDFLEYINKFVLISLPDLISINNLDILTKRIGYDDYPYSFDILINKFNSRPAISPSRINNILKCPVKAFIPYDRDIEFLFLSRGPFSIFNYNLRIVKNITDYAEVLYEELSNGN